jgi:aminopeptidase N
MKVVAAAVGIALAPFTATCADVNVGAMDVQHYRLDLRADPASKSLRGVVEIQAQLHMLRRVMGDPQFFAALKAYAIEYSYRNVATEDFRAVCERFYGKRLDWFFAQWIYGVSRPTYRVSWTAADDQLAVTIRQVQTDASAFRMPIDVLVTTAAGATRHIVWNDRSEQTFEIPMGRRVTDTDITNVNIDPDDWILKGHP